MRNYFLIIFALIFSSCSGEQSFGDIFIYNNDVYSVGSEEKFGISKPIYSKNGEVFQLESPGESAYAFYIFVSNGTVYVAGIMGTNVAGLMETKPVLWVNGELQVLDEEANFTNIDGIQVIGEGKNAVIYVLGNVDYDDTKGNNDNIVVWKNGERNILRTCMLCDALTITGSRDSVFITGFGNGIVNEWSNHRDSKEFTQKTYPSNISPVSSCYSEGDLYSVGWIEHIGENQVSGVFKNGELLFKTNDAHFEQIQVSKNEIYTAGTMFYQVKSGDEILWENKGMVWKNGTLLYDFSNKYFSSWITKLYFDGTNLYIFGGTQESIDEDRIDRVWKNGTLIESSKCTNCF